MNHPTDLRYTRSDWWLRAEPDGAVTLGITAWKANELGEVVFAELPLGQAPVAAEQSVGTIESVKSISELHAPFAGAIEAVNNEVCDEPSLVNSDPYGRGWLLRARPNDPAALQSALPRDDYIALRRVDE